MYHLSGNDVSNNPSPADVSDQTSPVTEEARPSAFADSDSDDDEDLFKPIPKSRTDGPAPDVSQDEVNETTGESVEGGQEEEEDDLFKPIPKTKTEPAPQAVEQVITFNFIIFYSIPKFYGAYLCMSRL